MATKKQDPKEEARKEAAELARVLDEMPPEVLRLREKLKLRLQLKVHRGD